MEENLLAKDTKSGYYVRTVEVPVIRTTTDEEGYRYEYQDGTTFLVAADHKRGRKYSTKNISLVEANSIVSSIEDNFDADSHPLFGYNGKMYGSEDWDEEDEIALMDDEERHAKGV